PRFSMAASVACRRGIVERVPAPHGASEANSPGDPVLGGEAALGSYAQCPPVVNGSAPRSGVDSPLGWPWPAYYYSPLFSARRSTQPSSGSNGGTGPAGLV